MMSHSPDQAFIHIFRLNGSGGVSEISPVAITDASITDAPLWIHLAAEDPATRAWLEEASGLSEVAVEGLLAQETRPRIVTRGENALVILRGVNLNPGSQPDDMVSARIWTDGNRVISTQLRTLQSTSDVIAALQEGEGPRDAPQLLVQWLARIVDRMNGTLETLEDDVLSLEERALSGERSILRVDFARLRKQCIKLRRYLAPQREALARLANEPLPWLDEMTRLQLREIADRQVRHVEALDEIRERAAVAHEELLSQLSEEMNQRMYVMSVAAAIFLPLGFLTGLMGINVGGMPGVENDAGFWLVAGGCSAVMVILVATFKYKNWM